MERRRSRAAHRTERGKTERVRKVAHDIKHSLYSISKTPAQLHLQALSVKLCAIYDRCLVDFMAFIIAHRFRKRCALLKKRVLWELCDEFAPHFGLVHLSLRGLAQQFVRQIDDARARSLCHSPPSPDLQRCCVSDLKIEGTALATHSLPDLTRHEEHPKNIAAQPVIEHCKILIY